MGLRSSLKVLSLVALVLFAVMSMSFASEAIYPTGNLGASRNLTSTPVFDITSITNLSTIAAGRSVNLGINQSIRFRALFLWSTPSVHVTV